MVVDGRTMRAIKARCSIYVENDAPAFRIRKWAGGDRQGTGGEFSTCCVDMMCFLICHFFILATFISIHRSIGVTPLATPQIYVFLYFEVCISSYCTLYLVPP